jgi:hypothetical protein
MATNETKIPAGAEITGAKTRKREHGFNVKGEAFPGVDPDTGERKAVTWIGLREEFGEREGARLYNALAVAAFGGVQPGRPALSLATLDDQWFRPRMRNKQGVFIETEAEYEKVRGRFVARREKALKLVADAEKAKGE